MQSGRLIKNKTNYRDLTFNVSTKRPQTVESVLEGILDCSLRWMSVTLRKQTHRKTAGCVKALGTIAVKVETQGRLSEGSQPRDAGGTGRHRSDAVPLSLLLCVRGSVALPSSQKNKAPSHS